MWLRQTLETGRRIAPPRVNESVTRHHLVVGAGGLFGQAIVARLREIGSSTLTVSGLTWTDDDAVRDGLKRGIDQLLAQADRDHWSVHWCAGKATIRSDDRESRHETLLLRHLLDVLQATATPEQLRRGSLTFASSAGGIYAKSPNPPFNESSDPRPNSPYGRAKLASENLLTEWCESFGVHLTIGRIASLYGSNQDLSKPQGLLSHLVRAALLREPLTLFVPMSTTRNYISANDAAAVLLAHDEERSSKVRIVNICASENTSIASLLHTCELIVRRRVPIRQTINNASAGETRDLRIATLYGDLSNRLARTPLHVGLHRLLVQAARTVAEDSRA